MLRIPNSNPRMEGGSKVYGWIKLLRPKTLHDCYWPGKWIVERRWSVSVDRLFPCHVNYCHYFITFTEETVSRRGQGCCQDWSLAKWSVISWRISSPVPNCDPLHRFIRTLGPTKYGGNISRGKMSGRVENLWFSISSPRTKDIFPCLW